MTAQTPEESANSFSPRPYVIAGYVTLALTFGVFGTWAATAPLASAVIASGTVSVESNRRVVQHLEGGIVREILVTEGEIVEAGQPLVRLDTTQAAVNFAVLRTRLNLLEATEARLVAESINAETIEFPAHLLSDPAAEQLIALQRTQFEDRKTTKDGQIEILEIRSEQLEEEIGGLEVQRVATEDQRESLALEIARLETGQQSGVVAINQLSQLTRQSMSLQGTYGEIVAEIARIRQSIAETALQMVQINQEFKERAGVELREIRDQISEVSERVVLASDILERTTIVAPVRGKVQELAVHTAGGVIRPADPVMDIIPLDDNLIINARVRPLDIDNVHPGMVAEVRLSAFHARTTPIMFGTIEVLSQDVVQPADGRTEPYYTARIMVSDSEIPLDLRERLTPGMPADVIIATGERTMFEYLIRPLEDSFVKGLREE